MLQKTQIPEFRVITAKNKREKKQGVNVLQRRMSTNKCRSNKRIRKITFFVTIKVIIETRIINRKKSSINAKTTGQKVGGNGIFSIRPQTIRKKPLKQRSAVNNTLNQATRLNITNNGIK